MDSTKKKLVWMFLDKHRVWKLEVAYPTTAYWKTLFPGSAYEVGSYFFDENMKSVEYSMQVKVRLVAKLDKVFYDISDEA